MSKNDLLYNTQLVVYMNYLAHAYLSFNQPQLLIGNMISDFVKGKQKFDYPIEIQNGIMLHRAIDEFTDNHPATHQAKQFFKKDYRLYAGAFVDVVYDHFLANDTNEFENEKALNEFAQKTYLTLQNEKVVLPNRFQQMLPYMQSQNWLYNYQYRDGIEKSFGGLVRRATYLNESAIAFNIFNNHYLEIQHCYNNFFADVKKFAAHHLQQF
ncbi:ACP phosphodiesterase [Ferruginibacter lapsinanis]|uniref:acyl carrier protein phosphodiesterase n=1 Tax=Ferruginibacter lapsinanis TaxID=563172 RepID=UPI001E5D2CF0|nr:ACP phosphodiesterase [Ferruginibacter lapsinanis]UEG50948.1 ACP phosphodiesterase [Ferruginibacter lapsinanis]